MAAGKYSFLIEQGATLSFELQYKDSAGTPIDLTGYIARMQIRSSVDSTTTIASLTATDWVNVTTRVADEDVEFPLPICETVRAIVSSSFS